MFYTIFSAIVIILMIRSIIKYKNNNVQDKLEEIIRAQRDGRSAVAKLTCLTKEGKASEPYYYAEYMYVANDKRYFVTYRINPRIAVNDSKEDYSGDELATDVKRYLTLFYGKYNPSYVISKAEVFASKEAIEQVPTNQKHNIYRDVTHDWTEAIDLTKY